MPKDEKMVELMSTIEETRKSYEEARRNYTVARKYRRQTKILQIINVALQLITTLIIVIKFKL